MTGQNTKIQKCIYSVYDNKIDTPGLSFLLFILFSFYI